MKVIAKSLIALVALTLVGAAVYFVTKPKSHRAEFEQFIKKYNKSYGSKSEHELKYKNFSSNFVKVQETNQSNKSYKLAINKYADLTFEEFKNIYLTTFETKSSKQVKSNIAFEANAQKDWVAERMVSPVKNQAACGSCWSFSTTGALESYLRIFKNDQSVLSEQELVDCSTGYGNMGCNGGLMASAYNYINDNGLSSESDYSYTAMDGRCNAAAYRRQVNQGLYTSKQAFNNYKSYGEVQQLLNQAPVAIAIEATNDFMLYNSGVLEVDSSCGEGLNHGVLLVGYGFENNQNYVKIKNSWGTSWGEQGYIRVLFLSLIHI